MIKRDIGEKEVEKCREGEIGWEEELIVLVSDKEEESKESKEREREKAVEKKDRTNMDGAHIAQDTGVFIEATEKFEERLADHLIVRHIQEKVTKEDEEKQEPGEDEGLPGSATPEGSTLSVTEE
jgi:hypothetical protein